MRPDVQGGTKKYVVLSGGVGFKPRTFGERKRKLVRGRIITEETYQVNMVRVLDGEKEPSEISAKPKPVTVATTEAKPKRVTPAAKKAKKPSRKKARG
jgi:small subunit ribosomal protein S6e